MATSVLKKPNFVLIATNYNGIISIANQKSSAKPYSTKLSNQRITDLKRGTGGRSSFNGTVATVFGASGFLGRYVCNKLGKLGSQVIVPYRGDHYDVIRLKLVGDLGQVLFVPFHLKDEESIAKACHYSNVVINLVGREWETKNFKFNDVNVDGARRLARIARESGVDKFIHVSALNACERPEGILIKGGSKFLSSKWEGEQAVREEFPNATIFRPADIYGSEDRFLRMYAHVWRHQWKSMPLWKKGELTVKQPVYVSDVAQAIVNATRDSDAAGKIYQAVGPKRYLLSELVDWFHRVMRKDAAYGYKRVALEWNPLFQIRTTISERVAPNTPFGHLHWERLEREHVSDQVASGVPTLEDLGVTLTHMEHQVPWELRPFRFANYYDEELNEFAKPQPPKEYLVDA